MQTDADQARICRGVLAALHPPGTPISVVAITPGERPHSVVIQHETQGARGPPRERTAECRFGGGLLSAARLDLAEVRLDGRPLPPATLLFLKRFWVDDPATAALQPALSASERIGIPELPRAAAITLQHGLLALPRIAVYALLAAAYALIYGLIGRINLAFGELAVIGGQGALLGAIAGGMATGGQPAGILCGALLFALAAAATHADAIGRLVVAPLAFRGGQPLLVATAALAAALMEYVRLGQGDGPRWFPPLLGTPVHVAQSGEFIVTISRSAMIFAALAGLACGIVLVAMRRTRFGREWRATSEEPVAAALHGIDTRGVLLRAMMLSGLLAGLSGFIVTMHYGGIGFSGGLGIGLKALIAAILGGVGSVGGAMAGAVILGLVEAAWAATLPIHLREAAIFSLLIGLLMFRPGGLFGFAGRDAARDGALR